MVGRKRAEARRQGGAALVGELLGVQLDRKPEPTGRLEHLVSLPGGEADPLAERVDGIDEALRRRARQAVLAEELDELVGTTLVFGWQRMRAEKGGAHGHRKGVAEATRDPQHPRLGLAVEAVAALDLDGGHAFGQQIGETAAGALVQRLLGCRPGRRDG